jgi:hypothetical protein
VTDLSLMQGIKYVRTAGSCVVSMMVNTQVRARVMKTLLVRVHRVRRVGKKRWRRGSNAVSRPVARAVTRSIAAPDSFVRSEPIALFSGRARLRTAATNSDGNSQAPVSQRDKRVIMAAAIESQDSSVSVWERASFIDSSSYLSVAIESHCAMRLSCGWVGKLFEDSPLL